ncbi:hypothetical protein SLEP1_g1515 [Rubroshorea leprosula]|uniref:Uncharacterized protein n=1 Tax=Rubroshorea leprosula TaxID=152421 RepID=A0AAV5HJW9_9ROSI|nr:hypothetical protein SLEP1_g1515 [Rubroshorea leprosula]
MVLIKIEHLFHTSLVLEGNGLAAGTRNERDLRGHLRLHHQLIEGQES